MQKLIKGIVEFRKGLTEESRELFAKLALGQKPDSLFIGCSDSRVVPNLFASTNPGDLFVLRNIGNIIPPFSETLDDHSAAAAVEFSIFSIKVSDIVVCGHSQCGAVLAVMQGKENLCCGHLCAWLKYVEKSMQRVKNGFTLNPALPEQDQISQVNVLQQIEHLMSYPFVRERVEQKKLRIHGWWFDIGHADVYCYEQSLNQFILIDEKEAELILQRLGG